MSFVLKTPESLGIPSSALLNLVKSWDSYQHVHSFILRRHGEIAAAGWWKPYDPETSHLLFSLSKSFISCAVGFAIAEKKLALDTLIADIFPEYRKDIADPRLEKITIRHLLTMASGHGCCSTAFFSKERDADFVRDFFHSPLEFEPGTHFVYNSGATFILSAAIRRVTGENPSVYLRPRMLDALGIAERFWEKSPDGTEFGGWGYRLTTGEIDSFAQMLLHGGKVNGRQVLPADYFEMAVSRQIDNSMNENPDWKLGYGFQFWRSQYNSFRGDGAFGQFALVTPEKDMTVSVTAGGKDMQKLLTAVWDDLMPHLSDGPLPEDPESFAELEQKLNGLALPVQHGTPAENGELTAHFCEAPAGITGLKINMDPKGCTLEFFREDRESAVIRAGWQTPEKGESDLEDPYSYPYSATAAVEDGVLKLRVYFYSTPFYTDFTITPADGAITVRRERNLHFRTPVWKEFSGRIDSGMTSF